MISTLTIPDLQRYPLKLCQVRIGYKILFVLHFLYRIVKHLFLVCAFLSLGFKPFSNTFIYHPPTPFQAIGIFAQITVRGVVRNLSRGAYILFFPGGTSAPLENPLKSLVQGGA